MAARGQNKQKEVRGYTPKMHNKEKKREKTKEVPFYSVLTENAHSENIINPEDVVLSKNKTA